MDPDPNTQPNIATSQLAAYIPMDRRFALAEGRSLPDRTSGAALFADVTGFTQVSAVLAQELGSQRGAEELTGHLNRVFGALIAEVHRYHGSVVSFAGDAITCWFDRSAAGGDEGGSARLALTCALAMQATMRRLEAITTPSGASSLSIHPSANHVNLATKIQNRHGWPKLCPMSGAESCRA